jgi:hypothetical protein
MNPSTQKRRPGLLAGGASVGLLALLVLAVAGVAIWTDVDKRDGSGYLMTNAHRYATPTRAIATREVTIGTEVPKSLIGKVRLETTSAKPVFVGIARKATVDSYLAGSSHATVKDLDLDPFKATYVAHDGTTNPGRPGAKAFWAASTVASHTAELTWTPRSGSWSIVVMNADGSPGVSVDVAAGARIAWLLWAGIGIAALGLLLLAVAGRMLVRGLGRTPGGVAGTAPTPAL